MKEYKFKSFISGDYECFCFAVDEETFTKIKGEKPNKYNADFFHKNKYKLHPEEFFGLDENKELNITIKIDK